MFGNSIPQAGRRLITVTTHEPYQPVRLYYTIPGKSFVQRAFSELRCMKVEQVSGQWGWFYRDEAASLTFGTSPAQLPVDRESVLLGLFTFPRKGNMTLTVRSCSRAVEAARFFGPILGPRVVARRARLVNRLFDAAELDDEGLWKLDRHLDRNVTVIDPGVFKERRQQYLRGRRHERNGCAPTSNTVRTGGSNGATCRS